MGLLHDQAEMHHHAPTATEPSFFPFVTHIYINYNCLFSCVYDANNFVVIAYLVHP